MMFCLPVTVLVAVPISALLMAVLLNWSVAERVYEVDTATFSPSLEGCLVKCRLNELHTEAGQAALPRFGLSRPGAIMLRSWYETGNPRVRYDSLCEISAATGLAPRILSGVREFRFEAHHLGNVLKTVRIDPLSATLPDVLKHQILDATPEYFVLRTADASNLAQSHVRLCFEYAPSPQPVTLCVLGRLVGNVIYVQRVIVQKEYETLDRDHALCGEVLPFIGLTLFFAAAGCLSAVLYCECAGWRWCARYVMLMVLYTQLLLAAILAGGFAVVNEEPTWLAFVAACVALVCMGLTGRAARSCLLPMEAK